MTCKAWRFARATTTDTAPAPQTRRQERRASARERTLWRRERWMRTTTPSGTPDLPKNERAARLLCRLAGAAVISRDGPTERSRVDDRPGSDAAGGARADGQEIPVARPVGVPAPTRWALQDLGDSGRGLLASQRRRRAVGEPSATRSGFAAGGSGAGTTADRQATHATERREASRTLRPLKRRAGCATSRTNVRPCCTCDRELPTGGGR
jgi:hypothetical protein